MYFKTIILWFVIKKYLRDDYNHERSINSNVITLIIINRHVEYFSIENKFSEIT